MRHLPLLLVLGACAPEDELTAISGPVALNADGALEELPVEATPPPLGYFGTLRSSAIRPGEQAIMSVGDDFANSTANILRGQAGSSCPAPLGGGCIDLNNASLIASVTTDASGRSSTSINVPAQVALGRDVALQAVTRNAGTWYATEAINARTEGTNGTCQGRGNLIRNSDMDMPANGTWETSGGLAPTANGHADADGLEVTGNNYVQQRVPYVQVSQLVGATFWTWHDPADSPAMSIEWTYDDGTAGSTFLFGNQLAGWVQVDLLALLDPNKRLDYVRAWGYSGGGPTADITGFDDWEFCY
jgi:hypothetical protein